MGRGHHDSGGNHLLEGSGIRLEAGGGSNMVGMGNGSTGILGDMSHVDGSRVGDRRVNSYTSRRPLDGLESSQGDNSRRS